MSDRLPAPVESFIREQIGSITELELLLLLSRDPNKSWSPEDAAKSLYVAPDAIRAFLERLCARGFCEAADNAYRFAPKTAELAELVASVSECYQQRRLTVINLIYAGPVEKFRNFADAFRLRRPDQ
jgi:hypothetical protein